jgi:hypothetical protein
MSYLFTADLMCNKMWGLLVVLGKRGAITTARRGATGSMLLRPGSTTMNRTEQKGDVQGDTVKIVC